MKQLIVVALIGITLLGCKNVDSNCGIAYFGGEIINPNNDHIVLYDATSHPIDTLYLDEDNRFFRPMENLNPGLYSFVHGGEYQVVLLEPNDSIMIRLNTYDFDESLVFTGKGSKKNNYLLSLFIEIESENKTMYELGKKTEPVQFQAVLDSIKNSKHEKLDNFLMKHPSSDLFNKVSKACIDYTYYAQKEIYPFRYFGIHYVSPDVLPDNYYAFRSEVDYDDEALKDFYPYYNFLFPHFNNLALGKYVEETGDTIFNRHSVNYNMNKLHLIDSLIGKGPIKNNLLKYTTRNFLSNSNVADESELVYNSFMDKSTNKEHKDYISDFYKTLQRLQPGIHFPDVELINRKGRTLSISTLFKKPTIIHFWTKANKYHATDSHEKVLSLREKHPDLEFVSINVNAQSVPSWKQLMGKNKFKHEHEYMLRNPEIAKKLLALYNIYKVIVVNENGEIISSNSNMFSPDFSNLLADISSYKTQ